MKHQSSPYGQSLFWFPNFWQRLKFLFTGNIEIFSEESNDSFIVTLDMCDARATLTLNK